MRSPTDASATSHHLLQFPQRSIRRAQPADAPQVAALVRTVWQEVYGNVLAPAEDLPAASEPSVSGPADPGAAVLDGVRTAASAELPSHSLVDELVGDLTERAWVALHGERIDGFCRASANCVEQLWVAYRLRRRGIGRALLQEALQDIRARGFRFAQAGCEDFNAMGCGFWSAQGWEVIAREPQRLENGRRFAVCVYSTSRLPES